LIFCHVTLETVDRTFQVARDERATKEIKDGLVVTPDGPAHARWAEYDQIAGGGFGLVEPRRHLVAKAQRMGVSSLRGRFIVATPWGDVRKAIDLPVLNDDRLGWQALGDSNVTAGHGNGRHAYQVPMVPPPTRELPVFHQNGVIGRGKGEPESVVRWLGRGTELFLNDAKSDRGNFPAPRGRFKGLDASQKDAPW
jgi:hypothetical protein